MVVGDLIGKGSSQEQSIVGETPNLAARLQALAPPGALLIAASTRQQIGANQAQFDQLEQQAAALKQQANALAAKAAQLQQQANALAAQGAVALENATAASTMSSGDAKCRPRSGLRFISCRTPSTSPFGVFIGTTSIDFVR